MKKSLLSLLLFVISAGLSSCNKEHEREETRERIQAAVHKIRSNVSIPNPGYGLGWLFLKNIGYGHRGARLGFLNLMAYDPDYDVSVVVMTPLFDLRNGEASFYICSNSLSEAAYAASVGAIPENLEENIFSHFYKNDKYAFPRC